MAKVSIIVPNYNHAKFLKQRFDSIFNQTYQDFEVIILDDCSTDSSVQILNNYAEYYKVTHFIVNSKNSGSTFKQWKKGIELAKGEYIWIAESDDYADVNFLERLVTELENDQQLGIAYCQSYIVDEKSKILCNNLEWTFDLDSTRWNENFVNNGITEIEHYLCKKNTIPNASAVLFRKGFLRIKDIPVRMKIAGDWFVWVSILRTSNLYFTTECLNYFRDTSNSTRIHNTKRKRRLGLQESIVVLDLIKKTINNPCSNVNKLFDEKISSFINSISLKSIFYTSFFLTHCLLKKPIFSLKRLLFLFKNLRT